MNNTEDPWDSFGEIPVIGMAHFHQQIKHSLNEWKEWCEQEIAASSFVLWSYNLRNRSTDTYPTNITEGAD